MASTRDEAINGLAKGLAIAECFDADHPRLSVADAARMTGQAPAVARRCLRTLEAHGYVTYDGKFFSPTPRFVRLATAFTEADPLPRLAAGLLDGLRDRFTESASLAVLDGAHVLFVARASSDHLVATGQRVGGRLPAPLSAAGRVLLGALDDEAVRRIAADGLRGRMTPKALDTPEAVLAEVRAGVERGWCLTDEEVEIGLRAVATPVRGPGGDVIAAMSLSALGARADVARMVEEFVPALQDASRRLGQML